MKLSTTEIIESVLEESAAQDFSTAEGRQFLSDAYVAVSAADPEVVRKILSTTRVLSRFEEAEAVVLSRLALYSFEFFWEMGTLQLIDKNKVLTHYPIKRYSVFVESLHLDLSTIEGIVSAGFVIQPEVFKIFQLSVALA